MRHCWRDPGWDCEGYAEVAKATSENVVGGDLSLSMPLFVIGRVLAAYGFHGVGGLCSFRRDFPSHYLKDIL